jgi:hypothetical protein
MGEMHAKMRRKGHTLGEEGGLASLVLGNLLRGVLLALLAVGVPGLRNVHL